VAAFDEVSTAYSGLSTSFMFAPLFKKGHCVKSILSPFASPLYYLKHSPFPFVMRKNHRPLDKNGSGEPPFNFFSFDQNRFFTSVLCHPFFLRYSTVTAPNCFLLFLFVFPDLLFLFLILISAGRSRRYVLNPPPPVMRSIGRVPPHLRLAKEESFFS